LRSQVQLFKLQHNDTLPDLVTNQWTQLMSKTNVTGAVDATAAGIYGPYLESVPKNPLNNLSAVTAAASATTGWTYDVTTGNIGATNQTPTAAFDESTGAVNYVRLTRQPAAAKAAAGLRGQAGGGIVTRRV